ncbi:MAG: 2-oxoacid:acceptor oxidoreductase family protein [Bacteroidota bacterium]
MKKEIKIGGLGGQGVILSGLVLGKAASIYDNKFATMTQSFGPEARGSACSAQLIVSDTYVTYPYLKKPEILVVMSQDAYNKFIPELSSDGILITEEELVKVNNLREGIKHFKIPATRFAEEIGIRLVLNIIMVGFFTAVTKLLSHDAVEKAVLDSIPKGTEKINSEAFNKGYEYGVNVLS